MTLSKYPDNYLQQNTAQSKRLAMVVEIEGLTQKFSFTDIYTRVRYGDPGLVYGLPGLVYGALKKRDDVLSYLTLDGSLTISQRLEPEQGRASISTFTLVLIDKDGFLTELCSPGVLLDEPLGNKEVKIFLGYQNTSYPEDYFCVFRGNISGCVIQGPNVTLNLSDPNQRRRQDVFFPGATQLTSGVDGATTTIPVNATSSFYTPILGPDGTYDPGVGIYIKLEDEWMKVVTQTSNAFTVIRNSAPVGESSAGAVAHTAPNDVSGALQLGTDATDPKGMNCITAALKIMLSGWGGPWITDVKSLAVGDTLDPLNTIKNIIRLPTDKDAVEDYGLGIGDYVTISGSTLGNDGTYVITDFGPDSGDRENRLIFFSADFIPEGGSVLSLAFRSQFDTLPLGAGVKMKPTEVDVATHVFVRDTYFSGTENTMQFLLDDSTPGKDFIESELYLPAGLYSLTRYGRLSIGYTRPAVADQKLIILNEDNVLEPEKISVTRSLVNRRFYNEIDYQFDNNKGAGTFSSVAVFADLNSTNAFRQSSVLPIDSTGIRTSLGGGILVQKRGRALLTRFKSAAIEVTLKANWMAGSLIESGDVVAVQDGGKLQIANLATGVRDIGVQLFEVIDRKLDVKSGTVTLLLLSGIFDSRFDRYGTISPSSRLDTGSTSTTLKIKPSYGAVFGVNEYRKWIQYAGLNIRVHSYDYTVDETVELQGVSMGAPNTLVLATPLGITPSEDLIVDLAPYPLSTDPDNQAFAKITHAFWSPSVAVASGASNTQFDVGAGDAGLFSVGRVVMLHNLDYSSQSPEVAVTDVTGTTITVGASLGFTPSSAHTVEFIGFADSKGAYRFL